MAVMIRYFVKLNKCSVTDICAKDFLKYMIMTTLKLGLVLHLSGIVMMVGMTIAAFVLQWQLWSIIPHGKEKAYPLFRVSKRINLLQGLGGLLIIAGGVTMMIALHGVVMYQSWFKIKSVLLGLIILNALFLLMPAGKKLRRLLTGTSLYESDLSPIRNRLLLFYVLQLSFFLLIFILSAFQPA